MPRSTETRIRGFPQIEFTWIRENSCNPWLSPHVILRTEERLFLLPLQDVCDMENGAGLPKSEGRVLDALEAIIRTLRGIAARFLSLSRCALARTLNSPTSWWADAPSTPGRKFIE